MGPKCSHIGPKYFEPCYNVHLESDYLQFVDAVNTHSHEDVLGVLLEKVQFVVRDNPCFVIYVNCKVKSEAYSLSNCCGYHSNWYWFCT